MNESTIIEMIAKALDCKSPKFGMGNFGDDAYTVPSFSNAETLVQSTDAFVEGTHFTQDMGFENVGWKSLVSAISDVYAMGANPSFYSLNLIVPGDFSKDLMTDFVKGLSQASKEYKVKLLGGDVTRGTSFSVIIQASGFMRKENVKKNSGCSRGDVIMTNSDLGHALLGLYQFKKGIRDTSFVSSFLKPKVSPHLGAWLSNFKEVTTLTDISDGLHKELTNMCSLSDVSVMVEDLPISQDFIKACTELGVDPQITCLQGGEEYGLLWTLKPEHSQEFLKRYHIKFKTRPHLLGRVGSGASKKKISYENQELIESIISFEHFN